MRAGNRDYFERDEMTIPTTIKIGPVRFRVSRCKLIGRNPRTWGAINYWKARIKIKKGISPQHQAVSLIHEIIHGALAYIGESELSSNERFVETLSEALTDTLWNSPGLLSYLKGMK